MMHMDMAHTLSEGSTAIQAHATGEPWLQAKAGEPYLNLVSRPHPMVDSWC